MNKGCERRTWALPDVSGGGERHDRFGVVVGQGGRRATDRGSFRPAGRCRNARTPLARAEMAQDALGDILFVDERNDAHLLAPGGATPAGLSFGQAISLRFGSREHFRHRSG